MLVKKEHFNAQETQPFFRYRLLSIGAQVGDEIPVYEYLIWNSQQVQAFKKLVGASENTPMCHIDDGIERFGEYLKQVSQMRCEQLEMEI